MTYYNICYWLGAAILIGISLIVAFLFIIGLVAITKRIAMRTYIFQYYELCSTRKQFKNSKYDKGGVENVLKAFQQVDRLKNHIFLPQLYEMVFAMQNEINKSK